MQVRPWGPSITPQAHLFKGDSDVEAKSKYDSVFQNVHYKPTLRLQLSLILRLQTSGLQMEEIVLLFIQWDE
jgi:hypothetical protein